MNQRYTFAQIIHQIRQTLQLVLIQVILINLQTQIQPISHQIRIQHNKRIQQIQVAIIVLKIIIQ